MDAERERNSDKIQIQSFGNGVQLSALVLLKRNGAALYFGPKGESGKLVIKIVTVQIDASVKTQCKTYRTCPCRRGMSQATDAAFPKLQKRKF